MVADGRILSHSEYYGMQGAESFSLIMIEDGRLADLLNDAEWSEYLTEAGMLWEDLAFSLFDPSSAEHGMSLERWLEVTEALA